MPEGDTLARARLRLEPILGGQPLTEFWARKLRGVRPRMGHRIEAVRTHGKHLLIDFDDGLTLDTHLGMGGSWRAHPSGSEIDRSLRNPRLRVRISTPAGNALCFGAPTIQTYARSASVTPLSGLGPDLMITEPDYDEIVSRARRHGAPDEVLAETLLEQGVAAGIGNIYRSETLFVAGLHPETPTSSVTDEELRRVFELASKLMRANARTERQRRSTAPGADTFVYERWRKPCRRCSTPIERSYETRDGRSTYWCPTCQPQLT